MAIASWNFHPMLVESLILTQVAQSQVVHVFRTTAAARLDASGSITTSP